MAQPVIPKNGIYLTLEDSKSSVPEGGLYSDLLLTMLTTHCVQAFEANGVPISRDAVRARLASKPFVHSRLH